MAWRFIDFQAGFLTRGRMMSLAIALSAVVLLIAYILTIGDF